MKQFPKTISFMKKYLYHKGDKLTKEQKFASFEFLNYQSVETYTIGNNWPMFFGVSTVGKNGSFYVTSSKDVGYVTGIIHDGCVRESFDYFFEEGYDPKNDTMVFGEYDHEGSIMFCDGNYIDLVAPHRKPNGIFGPLKRCLYGKEIQEYMFDYATQFWKAYLPEQKYLKIDFDNGHEVTVEEAKYLDEPLYNFLMDWYDKGYLDETTIIFSSDHGNQVSVILGVISEEHNLEILLPLYYMMIPVGNNTYTDLQTNQQIAENMFFNRDRFSTVYDIWPFSMTKKSEKNMPNLI